MPRQQSAASKIHRLKNEIKFYQETLTIEKNIYLIGRIKEAIKGRRKAIRFLKYNDATWKEIAEKFKIEGRR